MNTYPFTQCRKIKFYRNGPSTIIMLGDEPIALTTDVVKMLDLKPCQHCSGYTEVTPLMLSLNDALTHPNPCIRRQAQKLHSDLKNTPSIKE